MKQHTSGWWFPDADQFMADEIRFNETEHKWFYQITHLRAALRYVKDWSLAIDGGAHVGTWSRELSESFQRVIAVEPSADTCECLRENLKGYANVEIKQIALGNAASGRVTMTLTPPQAAKGNTGARYARLGGKIPTETIDSWELKTLGFLKLDIEGSELAALQGAEKTILRCRPIILFENKRLWERHFGLPRDAVHELLHRYRYQHLLTVSTDQIHGPI